MPRARLFAVAVAAIAVLTLACTTGVARDSSGAIIEEGSLSVFSMRPGDCFNDPGLPDARRGHGAASR